MRKHQQKYTGKLFALAFAWVSCQFAVIVKQMLMIAGAIVSVHRIGQFIMGS